MVPTMREPVMPNGWPIEIDPPLTFSFSGSIPSRSRQYTTCTAKASFSSQRSMSIHLQPFAAQQLRHGENRADAHFIRLATGHREAAENQLVGNAELRPPARATSAAWPKRHRKAEMRSRPSHVPSPLSGSKCGLSASSPSSVVSGRLHSSLFAQTSSVPANLSGLLVEQRAGHFHGRDLAFKKSFLLRARGALLARERVLILRLAG